MRRAIPMGLALALALLPLAGPALAQDQDQAPAAVPQPAELEQQLLQLNQQLQAAQAEIQRLRAANAELDGQRAAVAACTAKNDRLVAIGNELIAEFEKKYRHSQYEPFQLARRQFETELQLKADAIYQNKVDAVAPSPPVPPDAAPKK
jgi:septal ring factor EnvC (AmiA/AmiB activator)